VTMTKANNSRQAGDLAAQSVTNEHSQGSSKRFRIDDDGLLVSDPRKHRQQPNRKSPGMGSKQGPNSPVRWSPDIKFCTRCWTYKPRAAFNLNRTSGPDDLQSMCRSCQRAQHSEYRARKRGEQV
jgi:hypothetical protein